MKPKKDDGPSRLERLTELLRQTDDIMKDCEMSEAAAAFALASTWLSRLSADMAVAVRRSVVASRGQTSVVENACRDAAVISRRCAAQGAGVFAWLRALNKDASDDAQDSFQAAADSLGWIGRIVLPGVAKGKVGR